MMISTKGRYALRVLIDLAENDNGSYIAMKQVAERQSISLKYLERILPLLVKNGLIEGVHGKGGGYRLTRSPKDYSVIEILRLTEGDIAPVSCLKCDSEQCERHMECRTYPMWKELNAIINNYFANKTIYDLMTDEKK